MATQRRKKSAKVQKKAPARTTVRQALSGDAKQARMEVWAAKLGLPKDVVKDLQDKYGSYAYTMMQQAMLSPTPLISKATGARDAQNIKQAIGKVTGRGDLSSKNAVLYLAKADLSSDQIAQAVGEKSSLKVDRQLADDRVAKVKSDTLSVEVADTTKQKANEEQKKLEAKADKKKEEQASKGQTRVSVELPKAPWQEEAQRVADGKVALTPDTVSQVKIEPVIIPNKNKKGTVIASKATVQGQVVEEPKDSTNFSITTGISIREVGSYNNPASVKSGKDKKGNVYYGAFQFDKTQVQNAAIYDLLHKDEYGAFAKDVFDTKKKGFQKALDDFKADLAKNGQKAFNNPSRTKLLTYMKGDVCAAFVQHGKKEPEKFLQVQRNSACWASTANYGLAKIEATLNKRGIKKEDVNPAVWGAIMQVGIARGNTDNISSKGRKLGKSMNELIAGKSVTYINSPAFLEEIRKTFKDVFDDSNEKQALNFFKEHVNEKHSLTTMKELSLMFNDNSIYENYANNLAKGKAGTTQLAAAEQSKDNSLLAVIAHNQVQNA